MARLLLHVCCGPCAIATVRMAREAGYEVTGFFYNPNIHPLQEYLRRRAAMAQVAERLDLPMIWQDAGYDTKAWMRGVAWREEGEVRCRICYAGRLERTVAVATRGGYDAFSSSLLYSRRQRHDVIVEQCRALAGGSVLDEAAEKGSMLHQKGDTSLKDCSPAAETAAGADAPHGGPAFFYHDFRTGWEEGITLSKEWGIYRQPYCGCLFSENERYAKELRALSGKGR